MRVFRKTFTKKKTDQFHPIRRTWGPPGLVFGVLFTMFGAPASASDAPTMETRQMPPADASVPRVEPTGDPVPGGVARGVCPCNADVDGNGTLDFNDIIVVSNCANSGVCDGCVNSCDVNCDGIVDTADVDAVSCVFGGGGTDCCAAVKCAPPGDDCFTTRCDGHTFVEFGGPSIPPIPPGFFGPGSPPFSGVVDLGGQSQAFDTIVHRDAEMCFPDPLPHVETIPIEITQLALKSCSPIDVGGTLYDVIVGLNLPLPSTGDMTVTKDNPEGGTFTSNLHVEALISFEFAGTGIPAGSTIPAPVDLSSAGPADWLQDDPGATLCGAVGFFAGFTTDPDSGEACCTETCHQGPSPDHPHCVTPPDCQECPPETGDEFCPLFSAVDDPCATLQATDCLGTAADGFCRPRVVEIVPSGAQAFECACFNSGPGCGPVNIDQDAGVISCPGDCLPSPEPCVIFANGGSTGLSDAPITSFLAGTLITCECEGQLPPPDPKRTGPGTSVNFSFSSDVPPIPGNFFNPGSLPFEGTVFFTGSSANGSDTLIQRGAALACGTCQGGPNVGLPCTLDADCPGSTCGAPVPPAPCAPIPIEIVELRLTSTQPITVNFSGGDTELWDVDVSLSPTVDPPPGQLNPQLQHENGGTYDAQFPVAPLFTFTRVGDPGQVRTLDLVEDSGSQPLQIGLFGAPFVINLAPHLQGTILAPSNGDFVTGVRELAPGDPASQTVEPSLATSEGGGVGHQVFPPWDPNYVPAGQDCFDTECGATRFSFEDTPIPGGFFTTGPLGSLPFEGIVRLEGASPDARSTRVERLADMTFSGALPETLSVPIELVELHLRSCEPIHVEHCCGDPGTDWHVDVTLSPLCPLTASAMTVTKTHPNGGMFESDVFVQPRFTFTRVGDPGDVRVFDTADPDNDGTPDCGSPMVLPSQAPIPWAHRAAVDGCDPAVDTNFHPGIEHEDIGRAGLPACCRTFCHGDPRHPHCTRPPDCSDCPGACCNPADGGCSYVPEASCGGEFKGIKVDCSDVDGDGIADAFETSDCCGPRDFCDTGTDPLVADTDGDGVSDGIELASGTDACDPCDPDLGSPTCDPVYGSDCNNNTILDKCDIESGTSTDCNSNGIPDECEPDCNANGCPDDCDIECGEPDLNGNGIPDVCEGDELPPKPEPGGPPCTDAGDCVDAGAAWAGAECVDGVCYVTRQRALGLDPTTNQGRVPVAYRVQVLSTPDYSPDPTGKTWWIGAPVCFDKDGEECPDDPACTVGVDCFCGSLTEKVLVIPADCQGEDYHGWVAPLATCSGGSRNGKWCVSSNSECPGGACVPITAPVTRSWTEVPMYVNGCGILPGVQYEVRASLNGGISFSTPLVINTTPNPAGPSQSWGDVTGGPEPPIPPPLGNWTPPDGATNFTDIQGALRTFQRNLAETGAPPRPNVDLEINRVVNLADIQFLIKAFEGEDYVNLPDLPHIGVHPFDCPD